MGKTETWKDDAAFLQTRVNLFKAALDGDTITPLLRHEIHVAVDLFTATLRLPEIDDDHFKASRKTYERVLGRWADIHDDLPRRGRLLFAINHLQSILCLFLLEDYSYSDVPSLADPRYKMISTFDRSIKDYRAHSDSDNNETSNEGGDGSGSKKKTKSEQSASYHTFIGEPCKEMMVNEKHVGDLICWKAEGPPGAANTKLRRLIAQCDWDGLASLLFHDRKLVVDLFEDKKRSVGPSPLWTSMDHQAVLHTIDRTRKKYFQQLSDPSTFTLTGHAKKLSSKTAVPSLDRISSQSTLRDDDAGRQGRALWRFRALRLFRSSVQGAHNEARRKQAAGSEAAGGEKLLTESEKK